MHLNPRASSLHAAAVGLLNAILQAISAFGVHLTGDQNVAISAVVNSLLVVLSLLVIQGTAEPGHP